MNDAEELAYLSTALIIMVGTLAEELDRKDALDKEVFRQALLRKAFDAEETEPLPGRVRLDLQWIGHLAEALKPDRPK